jgi:hypothetical protein
VIATTTIDDSAADASGCLLKVPLWVW